MNVIVVIEGREAIPVRAIPLLTNWETMSSDALAMALAWDEHFFNFHKLQAFHLGDSQRPIPATWWENIACRELKALSDSIRAVEVTHETGLQDWRRKSLEVLPSGVFVWKDEFEPIHLCRYGVYGTTFLTASNGVMPREEQERRVALDFNPFILDAEIQRVIMDGFESATTTPSPTPVPQAAPVVAVIASGGTAVVWTTERKKAARAMMNEQRGQGVKAFAANTAAAFGVTPTRLRQVLNDKPKKTPTKKTASPWSI